MKKERNIITIDKYGKLKMPTDTTNVWMTEAELVELLGTTAGTVDAGIKSILEENVLHDYEVRKYVRQENGNGADVYNLEMVVALAFRLNTLNTAVFRRWLVKKATAPRRTTPPIIIQYKEGFLN